MNNEQLIKFATEKASKIAFELKAEGVVVIVWKESANIAAGYAINSETSTEANEQCKMMLEEVLESMPAPVGSKLQ